MAMSNALEKVALLLIDKKRSTLCQTGKSTQKKCIVKEPAGHCASFLTNGIYICEDPYLFETFRCSDVRDGIIQRSGTKMSWKISVSFIFARFYNSQTDMQRSLSEPILIRLFSASHRNEPSVKIPIHTHFMLF